MPKYNHSFEEDEDGTLWEHWTNKDGTEHTVREVWEDDEEENDESYAAQDYYDSRPWGPDNNGY